MEEFIAALPWRQQAATPQALTRAGTPALEWAAVGFAYLAIALLLRGFTFGSPVVHIDEQFYLLVGDRMLHGALPYVDIWDRKPIGLFLLFAAIRSLGGEGFVQYQVAAMLAAAGCALVIYRIARNIATSAGAWWAGVGYLLYLSAFNCFGGQATVFYNPLVALAALILYRAWTAPDTGRLLWRGMGVMALIGIALQIKYTVVFEGFVFGLALLARGWTGGWTLRGLILAALVWSGIALAPTALAFAAYAAMGHAHEFFFANFISIFGRQEPWGPAFGRLGKEAAALIPFWLAIFVAPRHFGPAGIPSDSPQSHSPQAKGLGLLRIWGIAAVSGFLVFGTWYDHYVTPLLVPLCVLAAPALGRLKGEHRFSHTGPAGLGLAGDAQIYTTLFAGFGLFAASFMTITEMHQHGTSDQVERVAGLLRSRMGNGCAYINEGDPALYLLTGSCFVSPYVFPNHLAGMDEAHGTGIDVGREVARIMASRPPVVMISTLPSSHPVNWQARSIVLAELARDYTRYAVTQVGSRQFQLFSLKQSDANRLASAAPALRATPRRD